VTAIESILHFAESLQAGARSVLIQELRLGLPVADAEARVPAALIPELLGKAAAFLGDPQIGLRLAAAADPRRHGLLNYLIATSPTLGVAWSQVCRYLGLWNEGVSIRQTSTPTEVALELRLNTAPDDPEGARQLLGLATTTLVLTAHRYAGRPVPPSAVEVACEPPAMLEPWEAALDAPVHFSVPLTRIVYPPRTDGIAGGTADPVLAGILGRHADDLLARLGAATTWAGRVRNAIVAELRRGEVHLAAIAATVAVSERTLQRRLRDEGTTFDALLDETRFALASSYLRDPALGIAEIAWLTGYAELAAFYRAFRRWTGSTPAAYRARLA
jgi:AraC-like DNA-binding protein